MVGIFVFSWTLDRSRDAGQLTNAASLLPGSSCWAIRDRWVLHINMDVIEDASLSQDLLQVVNMLTHRIMLSHRYISLPSHVRFSLSLSLPQTPPLLTHTTLPDRSVALMNSATREHIQRSGLVTSSPQVTDVYM